MSSPEEKTVNPNSNNAGAVGSADSNISSNHPPNGSTTQPVINESGSYTGNSSHWSDDFGKRAPNALTFLRLAAVPVFVLLLVNPTAERSLWATAIFVLASLTDWLDGYIARLYRAESILGTLLDPLADKVLVMAALVMLCAVPIDLRAGNIEPRVPAWMVVALLTRELLVTGLRSLAALQGVVVPASYWAKYKTATTMLAIFFLLIHESYQMFGNEVDFHYYGTVVLWIALALSVSTGIDYAVKLRSLFI